MEIILHDPKNHIWKAVVRDDGQLYLATIHQGSMTEEWKASLQPISFISLTPSTPLTLSLEKGLEKLRRGEEFGEALSKLIESHPELEGIIRKELKGGENNEIGSKGN